MEKIFSKLSRSFYLIPGGYFLTKFLRYVFPPSGMSPDWRSFRFRGVSMKVDISKQMGRAIYWRGAHDWSPIFTLEAILRKGDTFIDIGANQGEYTLWAARKVGPTGKVYSYEPLTSLIEQLKENISLNPVFEKVVSPISLGLAEKSGELELFTQKGQNEGTNTIFQTEQFDISLGTISLDTLDHQVALRKIERIDCIKIDVEGAELQVLQGGIATLKTFRPKLLLEINQEACLAGGYAAQEILDMLDKLNYQVYKLGLRGRLGRFEALPEFCNILAIPR